MTRPGPGSPSVPDSRGWSETVAQAARHIDERQEAESAAKARQRPRDQKGWIAAALVALIAVLAWDVARWTAAVDPLPVARERVNLAWTVVDVVEAIEDFRIEEGRLPTAMEIPQVADEDVQYFAIEGGYRIVVQGDGGSMSYDGSVDVDEWMATELANGTDGEGGA